MNRTPHPSRGLSLALLLVISTLPALLSGCVRPPQPEGRTPGLTPTIVGAEVDSKRGTLTASFAPPPTEPMLLGISVRQASIVPIARFEVVWAETSTFTVDVPEGHAWVRLYTADGNPISEWFKARAGERDSGSDGKADSTDAAEQCQRLPGRVNGGGVPVQVKVCTCSDSGVEITYQSPPTPQPGKWVYVDYYLRTSEGTRHLVHRESAPVSVDSGSGTQAISRPEGISYNEIDVWTGMQGAPWGLPKRCQGGCTSG